MRNGSVPARTNLRDFSPNVGGFGSPDWDGG